jgi:hypothetical protein
VDKISVLKELCNFDLEPQPRITKNTYNKTRNTIYVSVSGFVTNHEGEDRGDRKAKSVPESGTSKSKRGLRPERCGWIDGVEHGGVLGEGGD